MGNGDANERRPCSEIDETDFSPDENPSPLGLRFDELSSRLAFQRIRRNLDDVVARAIRQNPFIAREALN